MNVSNLTPKQHTLGQAVVLILSWLDEPEETPADTPKTKPVPAKRRASKKRVEQ